VNRDLRIGANRVFFVSKRSFCGGKRHAFANSKREQSTMTQSELERAVCRATGESRQTVRRYGFGLVEEQDASIADPSLVLDCPGCGARLGAENPSTIHFIECPRCDAVYPVTADEIYVSEGSGTLLPACA
jgi:hypothetical protein